MSMWRLRLQGEEMDLQDLAALFPHGPHVRIFEDAGHYFLELPQASEAADDAEALALGRAALDRLTAIARLTIQEHPHVNIDAISRFDAATQEWNTRFQVAATFGVRMRMRCTLTVTNADGSTVPGPLVTAGETMLEVSQDQADFARALDLYNLLDHDWRGLFIILEAMEDGNGGEAGLIGKRWVLDGSIKNFKATANSFNALRELARHGSTKRGITKPKMTIEAARSLIHRLLRAWARDLGTIT